MVQFRKPMEIDNQVDWFEMKPAKQLFECKCVLVQVTGSGQKNCMQVMQLLWSVS